MRTGEVDVNLWWRKTTGATLGWMYGCECWVNSDSVPCISCLQGYLMF